MRRLFQQAGLQRVRVDKAGNVLGERPGLSLHPHVVVAAHLDTVFPEGTNVTVRRNGTVLSAPGIGDDSRGLAVLVAIARALNEAHVSTPGTVTFVADVGEEGLGDLRGMRTLFDETLKGTVDRFVTIDGTGMSVSHTFVGSRRYRVTFKGPGGHSFTDFGLPNPISALGRAIAKIGEIQTSADSQTTFNVGRVGGGTSVNAIPAEAWMEIDVRSADRAALGRSRWSDSRHRRAGAGCRTGAMADERCADGDDRRGWRSAGRHDAARLADRADGAGGHANRRSRCRSRRSARATPTIRPASGFHRFR